MDHIVWSTGHELLLDNVVKAENCDIYDSAGKKYIDLESGVWCTSVGHCNPRVNQRMISQIGNICHTGFNYCSPLIEETAGKILEITGMPGGKCEFLCSGSEAVEYCLRAAIQLKKGKKTLTFSDSYFGAYGEATKKQGDDWYIFNWLECSCQSHGQGCTGECSEFLKIPFDQVGIFLFEPGSSSGLVRFPSQKLIERIAAEIRKNDGFIVVNEITTGAGRTGKWFGYQHYNVKPDMVAIGKGIGNGYPVSVSAFSARIVKLLEANPFHYSQSHQNDPLGAAVAGEVIDVISAENLLDRCCKLGEKLKSDLNKIKKTNSLIKDIRGRGLMIAVEFTKDTKFVHEELLKRGFIVAKRSGHEVIRIDPSLTISQKDIELFLEALVEIINEIQ